MPCEHARIIGERFDFRKANPMKIRVLWVEEPVVFVRSESRGNDENHGVALLREFISDMRQPRRGRGATPIRWEIIRVNGGSRQIAGDSDRDQNEIGRSIIGIEVYEVFQHRQGLVF